MQKHKIVFFLGSMNRGGAERVISILSKYYADKGFDTSIGLLIFNSVEYELDPTTKVIDFTGNGKSRIKTLPFWLTSIRKFIKKENPDVIVSFAARINLIVQIACIGLNKKIVVSERNDPRYDGRGKGVRIGTSLLYPHAKNIIFQTNRVKDQFSERVKKKGTVIPNPVFVTEFAENEDENKIVSVGRLTRQKNHKLLLTAFADVLKEFPQKQLYIYGAGELKEELESKANELNISDNVHLMGNLPNIHSLIKDSAMFVLSSDYEGLSNALLEAMVMGIPCISTDCAGSDEYIVDGENGLLVKKGNAEELAKAMKKFIKNKDLRLECGKNARKVADKVAAGVVLNKWQEVIESGCGFKNKSDSLEAHE